MKHVKTNKWGWLVVAAVLVMGFVACTNEDSLTDAPAGPQNAQKVHITVGASIADDATTRSEIDATQTDDNGKAIRTLKFTEGDKLYVYAMYGIVVDDMNQQFYPSFIAGMLEIDPASITDGKSASFTGDLATYEWDPDQDKYVETDHVFNNEDPLVDCAEVCEYPTGYFQQGVPPEGVFAQLVHAGSEATFDVEDDPEESDFCSTFWYHFTNRSYLASDIDEFLTSRLEVMANTYDKTNHRFALSSPAETAIFNCVISGLLPNTDYSVDIGDQYGSRTPGKVKTDGAGIAQFVADFYEDGWGEEKPYRITLKDYTNPDYNIPLGTRILEKKIYNLVRMWNGEAFVAATSLTGLTGEYTAQNGEILTGSVSGSAKVMIADGATVVLNGVDIKDLDNDNAAIECLGDATIILCGTNNLEGKWENPGLRIKEDKTLTIRGSGKLTASSDDGAGIGGGYELSAGNIIIEGGTITATSGSEAAGIGSGYKSSCGNIIIEGGTITATGGYEAAGIGSGYNSSCGYITISGGIITATGGDHAAGIGSGSADGGDSSCGDITISGGTIMATGGDYAAGIGSGNGNDVVIDESLETHTYYVSSCGNIIISGGTVTAIAVDVAPGIGSGFVGKYTSISIGSGITSVTATGSTEYYTPIGKGDEFQGTGDEGIVTIDGTEIDGSFDYAPYNWDPSSLPTPNTTANGHLTWTLSGNTWTLTPQP